MLAIILCVFRFVRLLGSGHQAIAVENLAPRLQLAAFKRKRKRPMLTLLAAEGTVSGLWCKLKPTERSVKLRLVSDCELGSSRECRVPLHITPFSTIRETSAP